MGQGPSTASGSIRKKLLDSTQTTRDIIDAILGYLLNELRIRDFYLLSSPTECKKYVLFLANRISSEFIQFQIEPTIDKSGTIAFRSVKDLTEPSEPDRKKRQFLCLELAYFYVRIFQIYGAIAMTLLDDASYTQERGYTTYLRDERSALKPAGMVPIRTSAKGPARYRITRKVGGTVRDSSSLGIFRFLNEALEDISSEGVSRSTYRVDTDGKPNATFTLQDRNKGKFTVYLSERSDRRTFIINISASENIASGQITMTLESIQFGSSSPISIKSVRDDEDEPILNKYNYTFSSSRKEYSDGRVQRIWKLSDDTGVRDVIRSIIEKITPYAQNRLRERGELNGYETSNRYGGPRTGLERSNIFEEKEGIDERLKISRTIDNLTRKRPIAHCVSRGLQLLDVLPLGPDTAMVESKICDTKFMENKISIPMDKPLSSSAGIMALASLFYSFIEHATPKIIQGSDDTKDYINFVQTMGSMFIQKDPTTGKIPETVKQLSDISSNQRDRYYCGSSTRVELPVKFARERVYPIIQALFNRQIAHAATCMRILEQLFLIRKIGKDEIELQIHPNIFKKGLTEINRISRLTRNTLVKYYQDCEMDYIKGLETIKQFRDRPATAPTAPPGPAPVRPVSS